MKCTECDKPILARGYCGTHYARWRNHGTVTKPPATPVPGDLREIDGYPNYYCSRVGLVFSRVRKGRHLDPIGPLKPMSLRQRPDGYLQVHFRGNSAREAPLVHQLILATWGTPKPSPELVVNHMNGNRQDNRIENLEWVTQLENIRHGLRRRTK